MKTGIQWKQNMQFLGGNEKNFITMDAKSPIGKGEGLTPKELVAIGLAGCTAMDVIAMMRKYKQNVEKFDVETDVEVTPSGHPVVFTKALMTFRLTGNIEREKLIEAVTLSQTKYCGVSAMLSKAFPIEYKIVLNNEDIASGQAQFE